LGRTFAFATGDARLALIGLRALDLAALRAGDFLCAAVRAAARDVGFFQAIDVLPFRSTRKG
jgi:hypothetical protein